MVTCYAHCGYSYTDAKSNLRERGHLWRSTYLWLWAQHLGQDKRGEHGSGLQAPVPTYASQSDWRYLKKLPPPTGIQTMGRRKARRHRKHKNIEVAEFVKNTSSRLKEWSEKHKRILLPIAKKFLFTANFVVFPWITIITAVPLWVYGPNCFTPNLSFPNSTLQSLPLIKPYKN